MKEIFRDILIKVYNSKTKKEQEIITDYFLEVAIIVKGFGEVANIIDRLRKKEQSKPHQKKKK